jgi:hypothetical protein
MMENLWDRMQTADITFLRVTEHQRNMGIRKRLNTLFQIIKLNNLDKTGNDIYIER